MAIRLPESNHPIHGGHSFSLHPSLQVGERREDGDGRGRKNASGTLARRSRMTGKILSFSALQNEHAPPVLPALPFDAKPIFTIYIVLF
ncbi:hypothetical protein [Acetobacter persici]|uniref:hypothetical protein n=1 Tax=Acetobacter persici TaxID=1076596 RepID=UPI00143007AE|nr:hypothetical protein [Acetobacter persici]